MHKNRRRKDSGRICIESRNHVTYDTDKTTKIMTSITFYDTDGTFSSMLYDSVGGAIMPVEFRLSKREHGYKLLAAAKLGLQTKRKTFIIGDQKLH